MKAYNPQQGISRQRAKNIRAIKKVGRIGMNMSPVKEVIQEVKEPAKVVGTFDRNDFFTSYHMEVEAIMMAFESIADVSEEEFTIKDAIQIIRDS